MQPSRRPSHQAVLRLVAVTVATIFVATSVSGCLGIERSEWAFRMTQITTLQDDGLTGSGIVVGIVDSGIDPSHPSLDHVDIVAWRDYVNQRQTPYDDSGHGTHVAGILAASGGAGDFFSGADLDGIAPEVSLVVVKACGAERCSSEAVTSGINFAVSQGVDILTLSLGGRQVIFDFGDQPLEAVKNAVNRGVYVVAAAGNAGTDHGDVESPSSATGAIAVGAVDEDGRVATFSSRGSEGANQGTRLPTGNTVGGRADPHKKPELVAPGVEVLSSWKDGTYATASGTSQAAPFVAGAIALLLEDDPEWRRMGSKGGSSSAVTAMKSALTESARHLDGQATPHDTAAGYGLLQAADARKNLAAR